MLTHRASIVIAGAAALAMVVLSSACGTTIEQLNSNSGQQMWSQTGRAYFLKKGWNGNRVIACDAHPNTVVCFDTNNAPGM